jgi:hypothetical protein
MIPAHIQAPLQAARTRIVPVKGWALVVSACCLVLAPGLAAQKKTKPKKEEITQTLQLPKELPGASLAKHAASPSTSLALRPRSRFRQVRDAPATCETGANPVLKFRAFVAGSGDRAVCATW